MHYLIHIPDEIEHVLEPSEFSQQPLTNYLYSGDVVGLGDHNVDLHSHPYFGMIAQAASVDQLAQPCKGSSHVRHVEIHGIIYKPGCALRLQEMDEIGERDYPVYGEVEEIVVWEDRKFFCCSSFGDICFPQTFYVLPSS
ncbi:uncharacterized protein LOC114544948 [Dendronephthya gigantea]|uniref:uncharacterized protein LOC114544948 n=1 Tax=Dendronephthya gigantea TaxID=151771 RepID=UPI00106CF342|nr:uncharacterized protein LOC114544948 [Dendronephthya gigantea]